MRKAEPEPEGGQRHDFSSGLHAGAGENEGAGAGAELASDLGVGTDGHVRYGSDLDAGAEGNVGFASNLDVSDNGNADAGMIVVEEPPAFDALPVVDALRRRLSACLLRAFTRPPSNNPSSPPRHLRLRSPPRRQYPGVFPSASSAGPSREAAMTACSHRRPCLQAASRLRPSSARKWRASTRSCSTNF